MPKKKKTEPTVVRAKFEVEAVQYVRLTIPNGGPFYGTGHSDAVHTFTAEEAFDLTDAIYAAARQL